MTELMVSRVIEDVATLKALADPIRMRVLELAMSEPERTWTAKELARIIGVPPTKIYYHLNQLEQHQLVHIRDTRVVNGIIEKQYGAGQLNLTFHRRSGDEPSSAQEIVSMLLDQTRDEIEGGLTAGTISASSEAPDPVRMVLSRGVAEIPQHRIAEFRQELLALMHRFEEASVARESGAGGHRFAMLVAMHPLELP
ncbi:helix-turn-helix domain-containing protein [Micromonospora sp. NBC_01813]|uniref:helix-turn-helix domain-containing protein n=1 Tax=Micromonospora sp. NBC_01813 TaxID=2975988 RepID=UPI002DDA9552|nr:helix-turn-helix domain-containing protein [Micromonospora sp. NBC_01813]WSA11845.1 helix-turn-helix domain-containing protein [Micromonospora sp. NBC_01813]